ncbi:Molybdate-anion transporter [Nowakowskiella sp. JEL0078]|nr:Molybdate-anion transporter [Nowakowskiella sp. JEL0078]
MNGLVAILSGVIADFVAKRWGNVAPFGVSLLVLFGAGIVVAGSWKENFGNQSSVANGANFNILSVGTMQSLFESSMYTFVFLWPVVIEEIATNPITKVKNGIPWGIIFGSFMVSIMIGSIIFRVLTKSGWSHERVVRLAFGIGAISLIIPVLTNGLLANYTAFNVFEFTCGLYFPSIGTLRGKFIPEEMRATIMNVFRIPLNLIVVVFLINIKNISPVLLFALCTVLVSASYLLADSFLIWLKPCRYGHNADLTFFVNYGIISEKLNALSMISTIPIKRIVDV